MEDMIVPARKADIGGFIVYRALPYAKKRSVGPFVFLDHMGPNAIDSHHTLDVRPHPHIGLATVTYLFEGRGFHRDSLGSTQMIQPGDLNWMTAGRGIVHSERTPQEDRHFQTPRTMHGVQIWVALPVDQEECEPNFTHWPQEKLPSITYNHAIPAKLLLGRFAQCQSPVVTYSRTLFMEFKSSQPVQETFTFAEKELALFIVSGDCQINQQNVKTNDIVIVSDPKNISFSSDEPCHWIVVGGDPFPEARHIWWNFVSSRKEKIYEAAQKWREQSFPHVPGETEFTPLPEIPLP